MRFEKLHVWKRAARLGTEISRRFDESLGGAYSSELVHSALSISPSIAEAYERPLGLDRARLLLIAKRHCGALRNHLYLGVAMGRIERERAGPWVRESRAISEMISTLVRAIPRPGKGSVPPSVAS
jgi:four helix bundle protein